MNIRKRIADARASAFVRAVALLVGGTSFAHAITALALPVVTRLYTPSDFSALAVFSGLLSIISVAACLRFDIAIPMPAHDSDAANTLGLAMMFAFLVSSILAVSLFSVSGPMASWLNQPRLEPYLWLLPVGVLFAGSYSALQYWFVRKERFRSIAAVRISQSCAGATTQIGFGWAGWTPLGLVLGHTLNSGAGCIGLMWRLVRNDGQFLKEITCTRMLGVFRAYDRFPKYSTFEALFNSAGIHLPIIMIAALSAGPEAGFLALASYVIQAPMGLIGTAISQVYLSRAPGEYRAERLGAFTTGVFGGLVKSGAGPLLFAGIIAPDLFATVFGEEWRRAGVLVSWMTPWFVMQFLSSPLSMALHVTHNQRAALGLQLFGLILRVTVVYGASLGSSAFVSEAYALSGLIFYLIYLAIIMHVVETRLADIKTEIKKGIPAVLLWSAGGCAFMLANKAVLWLAS